ncbi:MAG: ArdC-like ssDNA-binding domain-containing protein, partial [Pseudomonadota bacterium]
MGKTTKKRNVHAEITAKVIALIEAGTPPWRMPWDGGSLGIHPLRANGERYRGINVLLLWAAASARGFSVPQWMTYRQAQELGGQVTRGAKSEEIVYVGRVERESDQIDPATGEPAKVGIPFMKFYRVFNVAEVEGLPAQFYGTPATRHDWTGHAGADAFFAGIGADVRHGEPRAYYRRDQDFVMMPPRDTFRTGEGY